MIYIKKQYLQCYTRVSERRLSSRRKKSTCGVLPLKSPDLKPIETLWRELKFYLESKVKPHNKQALVNCIKKFWKRKVTPVKRAQYIDQVLQKVVPAMVEARGAKTKYYKRLC